MPASSTSNEAREKYLAELQAQLMALEEKETQLAMEEEAERRAQEGVDDIDREVIVRRDQVMEEPGMTWQADEDRRQYDAAEKIVLDDEAKQARKQQAAEKRRAKKLLELERDLQEKEAFARRLEAEKEARARRAASRRIGETTKTRSGGYKGKGKARELYGRYEAGPSLEAQHGLDFEPASPEPENIRLWRLNTVATSNGKRLDDQSDSDTSGYSDEDRQHSACFHCRMDHKKCRIPVPFSACAICRRCRRLGRKCLLSRDEETQAMLEKLLERSDALTKWRTDIGAVVTQTTRALVGTLAQTGTMQRELTGLRKDIGVLTTSIAELFGRERVREQVAGPSGVVALLEDMDVECAVTPEEQEHSEDTEMGPPGQASRQ